MNNVPWYLALLILTTAQLFTSASGQKQLLDTIFLRYYYRETANEYIEQPLHKATLLLTNMENNKSTVIYIHGFSESTDSISASTVVNAYLHRGDHNILAADYRNISSLPYPKVAKSASEVGAALAMALNKMVAAGLDPETLHIIGHSLGAQVAAHIETDFKIPRITGLDPAGPLFNFVEEHLSSKNARFVDIIHTDYGFYGIARTTGTVDFFPNGGHRIQPGCPIISVPLSNEDFCSHRRSWKFYAESLTDENAFIAVKCPSYIQFVTGQCKNNEEIPMGYATPRNAKGTFYLITRADSPFGLKEDGTRA